MSSEKLIKAEHRIWDNAVPETEHWKDIGYLFDFLCLEKQKLDEVLLFEEELVKYRNLHKLIDFIVFKVCEVLEARRCSLMLVDGDGRELVIRGAIGVGEEFIINHHIAVGEGVAGHVAQTRQAMLVTDIDADERFARNNRETYTTRSFMVVPIMLGSQLIGVLNVSEKVSEQTPIFTDFDLKILKSMARQSAFAIDNARLHRNLECLAVIDSVTHLHNRRYLMETLEHEMQSALKSGQTLCLMFVDINDFKNFNRDFGEKEGDHLLRKIAKTMLAQVKRLDVVCRYASDEFAVIMPYANEAVAAEAAEKIIKVIEEQFPITISIGVAQYSPMMRTYDFIRKASLALVQAQRGLNQKVVFYP